MAKSSSKSTNKSATIIIGILIALGIWGYNYFFGADTEKIPVDADGNLQFHFVDVGQGDSIIITSNDGNVLIDAGTSSSAQTLMAYIDTLGIDTFEYAVFTHPHEDHIGGADDVVNKYDIENVIMPDVDYDTANYRRLLDALENSPETNVIEAQSGKSYKVGDLELNVLAPNSSKYSSTNDYSVVIRAVYFNTSVMLTGDAEELSENEILGKYSPAMLDSDILKVGHHGSSSSSSPAFLDAVSPEIAVISCGKGNDYGHPHKETVAALEERNIIINRTDLLGTIVYVTDGNEFSLLQ